MKRPILAEKLWETVAGVLPETRGWSRLVRPKAGRLVETHVPCVRSFPECQRRLIIRDDRVQIVAERWLAFT